jgi:nifR3 family TIM-barrel protein
MVSVKSVKRAPDSPALACLFERGSEDGLLALQLFGAEPEDFAEAISTLDARGILARFGAIDINMGCPAPKVTRAGAGSALLNDLPRAAAIIAATVRAADAARSGTPVTVKTRLGWDARDGSAERLARLARDEGAASITIHGRTRAAMYSGAVDLEGIARVKSAVSIPVIGNGDVASAADAERMIRETGVDGVMIGRAAIGNPWVFRSVSRGEPPPPPGERLYTALRHAREHCLWRGEARGMVELRGQLGWYARGLSGAAKWRAAASRLTCARELETLIKTVVNEEI